MTEREAAWSRLHDAVATMPGWAVGPCQCHADGDRWHVTAVGLRPRGRQARREAIEATVATEVEPLDRLRLLLVAWATSAPS